MSTPTDSPQDELRILRARAYGPDADITGDPAALARLVELEDRERAASVVPPAPSVDEESMDAADPTLSAAPAVEPAVAADAVSSPVTVRVAGEASDADAPDGDASTAAPTPEDGIQTPPAAPQRPWWRRIPVLWTASVVAALLVGAGFAVWMQSLDSGHVAVLQPDPDAEWPADLWGPKTEGSLVFASFHGMSVLSQLQDAGDAERGPAQCLTVFGNGSGDIYYGGGGCGAGPFPAVVAMVIDGQSPEELRDAFSEGTALQFVLIGDEVHVYAKGPGIVQPTP